MVDVMMREQRPYVHRTFAMGLKVDVTNIGEVEALLDELDELDRG